MMGILMDWYASRGDETMVTGLRHCVENERWPYWPKDFQEFWWVSDFSQTGKLYLAAIVELSYEFPIFEIPSLPDAIRWLGERVTNEERS